MSINQNANAGALPNFRNLGILPQDRALNFSATNVFQFATAYARDIRKELFRLEWKLDKVAIERSTVCRPGSDCWDVEVYFFYPDRPVQNVRKVYRFTVDVSDTVPVTVGPTRSWFPAGARTPTTPPTSPPTRAQVP